MSETKKYADEYNELLCQAIDTIVAARLSQLSFDQTIVCTITDVSQCESGKYTVTNGSHTFEAVSEYTNYLNNTQVQVLIPGGDWSAQKTIVGRYSEDTENNPIVYVSPTDQVANLTKNLTLTEYYNEYGIAANREHSTPICDLTDLAIDTEIHNTICVKADFKTLLSNYNIESGVYGLYISIYIDGKTDDPQYVFDLSSEKDMFGRVYNYADWTPQEQVFRFSSSIGTITRMQVNLYQNGKFKYKNDNGEVQSVAPAIDGFNNILIRNLNIFFGVSLSTVTDQTVKVYTTDNIKYGDAYGTTKTIKLIWYNKGKGNEFLEFSDGEFNKTQAKSVQNSDNKYYWIEWFAETKQINEISATTTIDYTFADLPMTEIKAVVWVNGVKHEDTIQFFNELGDVAGKLDVEYSFTELDPGEPNPDSEKDDGWYDPIKDKEVIAQMGRTLNDAIWLATRSSEDGGKNWSAWAVTRIRGQDGTSPYLIELNNDSATVGVDVEGNVIGLEDATTTTVKVYHGSEDITNKCGFQWTAENGTVKEGQEDGVTSSLTTFATDKDIAKLTVTVTFEKITVGSKTLSVSKIPSTATYKLIATPQVIDMTTGLRIITFSAMKYTKDKVINISEGYVIKQGATEVTNPLTVGLAFEGATYDLYVDGQKWDSETVSVTRGSQYTSTIFTRTEMGEKGPVNPGTPSNESVNYFNPIPDGWFDGIPSSGGPFIWMSSATFKNVDGFKPSWSTPVLAMDVEGKFDVQYSDLEAPSADPGGAGWYSPEGVQTVNNAIWMATRSRAEGGSWSAWTITRIKGEDGTSPYLIELSNDSATIGATSSGVVDATTLKTVSTTTVSVYHGDEEVASSNLSYHWEATGGELAYTNTATTWFKTMTNDTATATVTAKVSNTTVGTKTFTISKNKQGASIKWLGELENEPSNGELNQSYKNTTDGIVYIYNGTDWVVMTSDGADGVDGAKGADGKSVFIVYNDSESKPNAPTGNGTTDGWYANPTTNSIWMSQKVANSASEGTWGAPIKIQGSSPYLISLSNDSATIGTNADGGGYTEALLKTISTVSASLFEGRNDVTNSFYYAWEGTGGTWQYLNSDGTVSHNATTTIYCKTLTSDTATATITFYRNGQNSDPIGSKTFTISKNKQGTSGANAITYVLAVSPNSINLTENTNGVIPTLTVTKYDGNTIQTITNGYVIKVGSKNWNDFADKAIKTTTTFDLYVNNKKVDTETLDVVQDGQPGANAVTYQLTASPNMFNLSAHTNGITPQFTVTKYEGSTITDIASGYVIKVGTRNWNDFSSTEKLLKATTTFDLYMDGKKVDSETVTKVQDGQNGAPGSQGPEGVQGAKTEIIRIYYRTQSTSIDKPTNITPVATEVTNKWTTYQVLGIQNAQYVFTSTGTKTTTYSSNSDTTGTVTYANDWTTPELFKALGPDGIDQQNYATYLRITNFSTNDGLYYEPINGVQKLAINATYIKGGVLEVPNTFTADMTNKTVTMAGWTVDSDKISKNFGANNQMVLSSGGVLIEENPIIGSEDPSVDEFVIAAGTKFGVTKTGKLYANGANITGAITATSGQIGGWTVKLKTNEGGTNDSSGLIGDTYGKVALYTNSPELTIAGQTKQDWRIVAGANFGVREDGSMYASSGKIGGWTIAGTSLSASGIILDSANGLLKTLDSNQRGWQMQGGTFKAINESNGKTHISMTHGSDSGTINLYNKSKLTFHHSSGENMAPQISCNDQYNLTISSPNRGYIDLITPEIRTRTTDYDTIKLIFNDDNSVSWEKIE